MDAMLWWLIPITATLLAVAWVSWNGRTRRPADPHDTLAAHRRFTEALASPAPEVSRPADPPEGAEQTDDSDPAPERRRSA
jgi:hypothetical protein